MEKKYVKSFGWRKLRSLASRVRKRLFHGTLILLYHRVSEQLPDPQRLCVTPRHFVEHLDVLCRNYSPIRLGQLAPSLRDRKTVKRSVVLTFDDGYRDNFLEAKPPLERHSVPATVFVTTGYISGEKGTWWDRLQRVFLHPRKLPKILQLTIEGKCYRWELGNGANYGEFSSPLLAQWNVEKVDTPTVRHRIYRDLFPILRRLHEEERQKILTDLLAWADADLEAAGPRNMLTEQELVLLAKEGLFEIGAHSVTHPILSQLPPAGQREEIWGSKKWLEDVIGCPVTSFSYPFGSLQDYTSETTAIVRESGLACACSNFPGLVFRSTDPFQLPRFLVRDWDGPEFSHRLDKWFRG